MQASMGTLDLPELRTINDYKIDKSKFTMERNNCLVTPATAIDSSEGVLLYEYSHEVVQNTSVFGQFQIGVATLCFMDSDAVGESNCRLLGFVTRGSTKLLVAEDLGNSTLEVLMDEDGAVTRDLVLEIAYQVAKALSVYADLKIPHQGVHPSNIFQKEGIWILGPPFPLPIIDEIEVAEKNVRCSSPETPFGSRSTYEGDIWSYGVLLQQMLDKIKDRENAISEIIHLDDQSEGFLWKMIKRRTSTATINANLTLNGLISHCLEQKTPLRWSAHRVIKSSV